MSSPTPAQRLLAERHKSGTVLSQKERSGRAVLVKTDRRTPFFAANESLLAHNGSHDPVKAGQSAPVLSTQIPNPLLDLDSLLPASPFVSFGQEVSLVDARGRQQNVNAPATPLPTTPPNGPEPTQQGDGQLKTAFSTDFRVISIEQAPSRTEPIDSATLTASPQPNKAPATPQEDSQFQSTISDVRAARRTLRKHPKPGKKLDEYTNAAVLAEPTQKKQNARNQHLNTIDEKAEQVVHTKPVFKPETFKELLKNNLAELEKKLPHDEKKAKQFKRDKPLEAIKQNIGSQVNQVNATQLSSVSQEVGRKEPPPSSLPVQPPQTYTVEPTGHRPSAIDSAAATPKPKTDAEISMEAESRSMDDLMTARKMTDQQLAESNEPSFLKTLNAKQQAKQKAIETPQVYRQTEQQTLSTAQQKASSKAQAKLGGMVTSRQQTFLEVFQQQNLTELVDKGKQILVDGQFLAIYDGTKNDVKRMLDALSTYVDDTFTRESDEAKKQFEKVVEDKLDDIHGWGVKDFFFGEDTEAIETVFAQEGSKFKRALGDTLDKIADEIAARLNEAVNRIDIGRQDAKTLFNGLSKEQQQLHSDTYSQFTTQFDNLQSSVDEKQTELAQALAESYKANVDSLRETFDKLNEEARKTWIDKAAEFIEEAATAIYRLGKLLLSVLSRLANLIGDILAHPIRFLENVGSGLKLGFSRFADKFDEYLLTGFFDWLRGSVAGAGIKMPDSFDAKGLFGLATQLVGLDYATFREVAVDKLGSPVVEAIEKGEEWIQEAIGKGIEIFHIVQKEGLGGLWEHAKSMIAEGISELFDKIKKTILYETIKKVLAYVATLFNPVGAFIQAAMALYHGIQFLIGNIDRLEKLVNAFLNSLELAVKGDVSGIADKIVFALRNAIVLAIDFLAKLLNLGSLVDKARAVIKTIRQPIIRAMGWVVDKVKPLVNRVVKGSKALVAKGKQVIVKGKEVVVQTVANVKEWLGLSKSFKAQNGESHTISIEEINGSMELMLASRKESFERKVENITIDSSESAKVTAKSNALKIAKQIDNKIKDRKNETVTPDQQKQISRDLNGFINALSKETALILPPEQAAGSVIANAGDIIQVGDRRVLAKVLKLRTENDITYLDYATVETEQGSRAVRSGIVEIGGLGRTWWRGSLEASVLTDKEFQMYKEYGPDQPWPTIKIARAILNYRRSGFQRNSNSGKEWEHKIEQSTGLPQIHSARNLFWVDADFNRWLGTELGRPRQKEIVEGDSTRLVSWREYLQIHGDDDARKELKEKLYKVRGYKEVDHDGPNGFWRELSK